ISSVSISFQSKWIYLGTKAGNVHVVNIESFQLSGYTIHWNKAIERSQKEHPGPLYEICENPQDANKLLLGYETGLIVLWDLKSKVVDQRFQSPQKSLRSVAWYSDGKQFVSSHQDGSLSVWNIKNPQRPLEMFTPHSNGRSRGDSTKATACSPITKVCLVRDSCFLFSGGLHYGSKCKGLTIMEGKTKKLLHTKPVVDFVSITDTPWESDEVDAVGIIVLLQTELIVYDLSNSAVSQ
ncbi:syntaxin-binding 5-like, partial, partial [Paramuricea clavata]